MISLKNKTGWKVIPKLHGDPRYATYVERMAKEIASQPKKAKPIKPEGMSEKDFIMSLQPVSMQELMKKHEDPNYVRDWTAPLPESYLAKPEAKTLDDLVGTRSVSLDEISHVEARRRASKNTVGQSSWEPPQEKKDKAIDHFLSHPGIPERLLSDDEIMAVKTPTKSPKAAITTFPTSKSKERSLLQRLFGPKEEGYRLIDLINWDKKK